jgi:hypothetical protein
MNSAPIVPNAIVSTNTCPRATTNGVAGSQAHSAA